MSNEYDYSGLYNNTSGSGQPNGQNPQPEQSAPAQNQQPQQSSYPNVGSSGATTANTMRYIDFAARHGFSGVLVEGWNYGWDGDWTRDGDKFSFTRAYPDYDLKKLADYARQKGLRLIAHNETGGAATNYEQQLDSAYTLYRSLGINAVKTGYVNPMLDHKELQHSQYGVRHYLSLIHI